jgi:glycine hydroxymethyltransferase
MAYDYPHIQVQDPDVYSALIGEENREASGLELIPSENYVSAAVREAQGSVMTNKYAEGLPGNRYYGGQEYTDAVEELAIDRACNLFGAHYANVQPLSGAPANLAMYFALLEPGDTVLGMDLSHGGHLTHGHPVTAVTKVFNFVRYKMKDVSTGEIDYEALRETAKQERPKMILAGYSAYPRDLDYERFVEIAREVDAYAVADVAHVVGLIAGGALKNPFDYGFDVMTSTTHKTLRGPRGGLILTKDDGVIAKSINKMVFPGLQGGPHMHQIAGKAVCFKEALDPSFAQYAQQVVENARAMADVFHERGIRLIAGGTDNHLVLADVYGSMGIGGKEAQNVLDEIGVTCNKNAIADDERPPQDPSGIRFGTPALTTRGMGTDQSREVASLMVDALERKDDGVEKERIRERIEALCHEFPIPESFITTD